jgi:hypothetical protein
LDQHPLLVKNPALPVLPVLLSLTADPIKNQNQVGPTVCAGRVGFFLEGNGFDSIILYVVMRSFFSPFGIFSCRMNLHSHYLMINCLNKILSPALSSFNLQKSCLDPKDYSRLFGVTRCTRYEQHTY